MRFLGLLPHVWCCVGSCVCAVAVVACGGAADSLLEEAAGTGTGTVTDASTGPTSSADSSATTPNSHDSGSPTKPDPDANTTDPNPPPDAAQMVPPPDDAATEKDSAPPPPADGITCGTTKCDPTSQVCCITGDGNGGQDFSCDTSQDCNDNGGLSLPCADAADCIAAGSPIGTVCCVTVGNGGGGSSGGGGMGNPEGAASVACVAAIECADTSSEAWMCDPDDSSGSQCPPGDTCTVSTETIPPYSICK